MVKKKKSKKKILPPKKQIEGNNLREIGGGGEESKQNPKIGTSFCIFSFPNYHDRFFFLLQENLRVSYIKKIFNYH